MKRFARKLALRLKNTLNERKIGRGPIGLIDVGSIGGLEPPWNTNYNRLRYLLNFEPNDRPVKTKNTCTFNTALWEEDAELPFYIYKGLNTTGSSLFKQDFDYVDSHWAELKERGPKILADTWHERSQLLKTINIRCRTLDGVLTEEGLVDRLNFLKIDAQGAESRILKGGIDFLSTQCVGLHLELFDLPLYKGIDLKTDVVEFLERLGFLLLLENPSHGTFDSQNDCIFLHKDRGSEEVRRTIREVYSIGDLVVQ